MTAYYNGNWLNVNVYIPIDIYPTITGACNSSKSR